jgi:transposase
LYATRDRLAKHKAALLNVLEEYSNIGLSKRDPIMLSQMRIIKNLQKEIEKIDQEMKITIEQDPALSQNYQLLQTIKGVGKIVATATLIKTRNFTRFTNTRKFACFCGIAPFENTSGTSIKGRTRVSHMADKQMKGLLHLSAQAAVRYDKELKDFYLRRTANGKSKMSTLNIIRNKIVYRMFAVVKRQTPFSDNYLQAV